MVGDLGDDLLHPARHVNLAVAHVQRCRFLLHDVDFVIDGVRVVGADLGAVAILERRDDAPAVGVVLWIRRGDEEHVQRQAHLVAANLHVALLEHVQQAHLNALGQIGQLVDGEDAPVHPGQQAEVQRRLVVQIAAFGHLDGIDLADQIGDGDVRRRQLLAVAFRSGQPRNGRLVARLRHDGAPLGRDRAKRILGDLRPLDDRRFLVEQRRQPPHQPRFRLPPLAKQHDVLPAENGVHDLRNHRLVVADDARKQRLAPPQLGNQVAPHLGLHRQHLVARRPKLPKRLRLAHRLASPNRGQRVWQLGGGYANGAGARGATAFGIVVPSRCATVTAACGQRGGTVLGANLEGDVAGGVERADAAGIAKRPGDCRVATASSPRYGRCGI